jgi:hypothetical protein
LQSAIVCSLLRCLQEEETTMENAIQLESGGGRTKTLVLAGAILSAVTTIAVSLIQTGALRGSDAAVPEAAPPAQEASWQIAGQLSRGEAPGETLNAEVLLIPAGSPYLTTTDSQGKFLFDDIAQGGYWLLVRQADSGLDARVLVEADGTAAAQAVPLLGGAASVAIRLQPKSRSGTAQGTT